ncbi:MAG: hypothetical protein AAGC46_04965 [Solirubrobacteraceae bacterium]|nr:hypothetical protein [Patulibacter sp.]
MPATTDPLDRTDGCTPVVRLHRDAITALGAPGAERASDGVTNLLTIAARTPWSLTLTPLGEEPRVFGALFDLAVEARSDDDTLEIQGFDRTQLVERVLGGLTEAGAAAQPERVRRPVRIPPVLLHTLASADGGHATDEQLLDLLLALPDDLRNALGAMRDGRFLERAWSGAPLGMANLLVLHCGEHGRWAFWERLDASEPWNFGTARAQRVDDERLEVLVRETIGDLVEPEPLPTAA